MFYELQQEIPKKINCSQVSSRNIIVEVLIFQNKGSLS